MDSASLLIDGAKKMGISLSNSQSSNLIKYLELIIKWNKTYNLSAIRSINEGINKHLLDSLSIINYIGNGKLLDVGSGAGLPGVVISIMKPELSVTVLDGVGKKCRFMQFAKTQLELNNLEVVNTRVEEYQVDECFMQITSRAFAQVDKTLKLTKHLLCDNGVYLLMKGDNFNNESLDGVNIKSHRLSVPHVSDSRFLLEVIPS